MVLPEFKPKCLSGSAVYQRENSPKLVNGMLYIGKYIFQFLSLTSLNNFEDIKMVTVISYLKSNKEKRIIRKYRL